MALKFPFAYCELNGVITPDVYKQEMGKLWDSELMRCELIHVNSKVYRKHFKTKSNNSTARDISGCNGEYDSTLHFNKQIEYKNVGYLLEVPFIFDDGSFYIVDCYNPETNHIVEVVHSHGDLDKAKVLNALGLNTTWHFVSSLVNQSNYKRYGTVIDESKNS